MDDIEMNAWKPEQVKRDACNHKGMVTVMGSIPYHSQVSSRDYKKTPVYQWGDRTTFISRLAKASKVYCRNCSSYLTYEEARAIGITLYEIPEKYPTRKEHGKRV